jgi:hypothetical protein
VNDWTGAAGAEVWDAGSAAAGGALAEVGAGGFAAMVEVAALM